MGNMQGINPNTLPTAITSYSRYFCGGGAAPMFSVSIIGGSVTWAAADVAYYLPFYLPWDYPVRRVFWGNGATLTGNRGVAIYSQSGTKIYSTGGVAGAGATTLQYVDNTDFWLPAGSYYMGVVYGNSATSTYGTTVLTVPMLRAMGVLQQTAANPLPDVITGSAPGTAVYPLIGFTRLTS